MTKIKTCTCRLVCEECALPIETGTEYVEMLTPKHNDTYWLHASCYAALLAGIDAWLCQEEEKNAAPLTGDIPF